MSHAPTSLAHASEEFPDDILAHRRCCTYLYAASYAADAQWAGVAYALPHAREQLRLAELNQYADSFCTNMHKWGLVGFDCC